MARQSVSTERDADVEVLLDVWDPKYRTAEYLGEAIDSLRTEHGNPSQRFGVYVIAGLDPRSGLGRAVEVERFGESYENDVHLLRDLYGDFEDAGVTELICVVDHEERRPCGVIRLVRNTAELGCRILNDLQAHGDNGWGMTWEEIAAASDFAARTPEEIIDIPTIAVSKAYQGHREVDGISKALYAMVFQHALRSSAETWVCSLERVPYILVQVSSVYVMNEFRGVESKPYYGAPDTVPLWSNFRHHEAYLRKYHPSAHAMFTHSDGLTERYYFGFSEPAQWEPLSEEVIDLRLYSDVPTS
ncbi:MAG: hypothetical protein GX868_12220 [Actinobacteria bacterium]|nr:hypothetical protein [Actinomycetota bacterium]